jgi:hypothetical protein
VLESSSDEEEDYNSYASYERYRRERGGGGVGYRDLLDATVTPVHRTDGYLPTDDERVAEDEKIPWASAMATSCSSRSAVEATNVVAVPSNVPTSPALDYQGDEDDFDADDDEGDNDDNGNNEAPFETAATSGKKKKKKKKKKSKKKKKTNSNSEAADGAAVDIDMDAHQPSKRKAKSTKSISFGTVSVREYARTVGEHVVPADGGWPLGMSCQVITEHPHHHDKTNSNLESPSSSPSRHNGHHATEQTSPTSKHHHHHKPLHGWTVDDFEARRQLELQERYTHLIREQRRRKFEKEWERNHRKECHKNFGKQRRSSGKGGSASNRSSSRKNSSGLMKMEMSNEEKEQLEQIINEPVVLPNGVLETRPYDYKKKIVHSPSGGNGKSSGNSNALNGQHNNLNNNKGNGDHVMTEEDELYHLHGGRNPLFSVMREDERRRTILRDDHLLKCHVINDDKEKNYRNHDDNNHINNATPPDPTDPSVMQHIQHDLETIRIQRSDPTNLGCSCRKLHVFLPGATDKSHHKKKGSHRRLPERKVREELRRRGLLPDNSGSMKREDMEVMLHSAIEKEPCCWGGDCPCVRNGIGCQADTCSCWHPSHDVAHTTNNSSTSSSNHKQEHGDSPRRIADMNAEAIQIQCGNSFGTYVVNFGEIRKHRERFVAPMRVD